MKVYVVYEDLGMEGYSSPCAVLSSQEKANEWIGGTRTDSLGSYGFKTEELEVDGGE